MLSKALVSLFLATLTLSIRADGSEGKSTPVSESFTRDLTPYAQEFQFKKGQASGSAWTGLLKKIQDADALIIGEDHGFHEIASLVEAMTPTLAEYGYRHFVIEVDPVTAKLVEKMIATSDTKAVEQHLKNYPYSLPFFTQREEYAIAQSFYKRLTGEHSDVIWGLDQIFLFQAGFVLEELASQAKEPRVLRQLAERTKKMDSDYFANRKSKTPRNDVSPGIFALQPDDFRTIRAQLNAGPALEVLDHLQLSLEIYRGQSGDSLYSNTTREEFMKSQFDSHLRGREKSWAKFFLKFGLGHAEQGRNNLDVAPLGGHIRELAKFLQKKVLSVAIIPGLSSKSADLFGQTQTAEELPGFAPIYALAKSSNPVIIDPVAAMRDPKFRTSFFKQVDASGATSLTNRFLSFDAIIIIPQASPSHSFAGTP